MKDLLRMCKMTVLAVSVLALSGCGGIEAEAAEPAKADGKTLVVYYSATGTTRKVAEMVAAATNGDIFELVPAEPYSADDLNYRDKNSRVSKEHDSESRDVKLSAATVSNWGEYDTVFIGYPIWWGIAAWPVDTFVKANDFSGKKVIPFATAATSGLGDSGSLLQKMTAAGEWLEGECFHGAAQADVEAWLKKLGL